MPRSLRGAIHRQCGDFSRGQGERANFEYLSAARHLPEPQCYPCLRRESWRVTDVLICSWRLLCCGVLLALTQTWSCPVVDNKPTESFLDTIDG